MLAALVCGLIFGWGLLISGMTQPAKVIGFLDVFGAWDPTLAVVMASALAVSAVGFTYARARGRPVLASVSAWPARTEIDAPLVAGSVMFGMGWGLVGLCPGPALENLATLSGRIAAFVIAMVVGIVFHGLWQRRRAVPPEAQAISGADG
jgi:uncharacterized protein